jgi:hypothetical protein
LRAVGCLLVFGGVSSALAPGTAVQSQGDPELQGSVGSASEEVAAPLAEVQGETPSGVQAGAQEPGTTAASAPHVVKSVWDVLDLDLFRRATAPIPAGIPVARTTARKVKSAAAIAELGAALAGPDGTLWMSYLGDELRYGQSKPERWASTAKLVATLELFELAPGIVAGLELDVENFIHQAAWSSLAELYGRRFQNAAEWEEFVGEATYNPMAKRAIAELRERSRQARDQQLELFVYHLDRAAAHLSDSDPLVRLGAAEVLGAALRSETVDRDATLDQLLARLTVEHQAEVLSAMLDALFTVLENMPAGDPHVERLREILADCALAGAPSAELLIARALARLQWAGVEAIAADSLESGVALLAAILRRTGGVASTAKPDELGVLNARGGFEQDADVLQGVLKALDKICLGVGGDSVTSARLAANVDRSPLLQLVLSVDVDHGVREVAAGTLPRLAPPEDVAVLIEVLCSGDEGISSELRFRLMGAMKRFVERDDASPEQIGPVVSCLLEHTGRPEEHMRERALTLLLSDALTAQVTKEHARLFIERLAGETAPSLQEKLLLLIERNGDRSMLDGILSLPNFDSLVARGGASEKMMVDLVTKLAGDDPMERYSAAKRLYPRTDKTARISQGTRALGLIAALPQEAVVDYSVSQHRDIVKWAFELRVYGKDLAKSMPNGVDFLQRLVDIHVPKSGGGEAYSPPEKALFQALFLSDIATAKGNGEATALESAILAKFGDAEEKASSHTAANFDKVIFRARARFYCNSGQHGRALKDFNAVFTSAEASLLEPADLRSAVLAALAQSDSGESAAPAESDTVEPAAGTQPSPQDFLGALNFGLALVNHPSWHKEPEPVRYEDLWQIASHARSSEDLEALANVQDLLAALPSEVISEAPPVLPGNIAPNSVWFGLDGDANRLAELNRLLTEIEAERIRLEVLQTSPANVPDPSPEPALDKILEVEESSAPTEEVLKPTVNPRSAASSSDASKAVDVK